MKHKLTAVLTVTTLLMGTRLFGTTCITGKKFSVHQVCGQVQDEGGAIIPCASVSLKKARATQRAIEIPTDQQGRFQFDEVASGEYELRVKLRGFWDALQPFTVTSPRKSQTCRDPLRVVMKPAGSCSYIEKLNKTHAQTH